MAYAGAVYGILWAGHVLQREGRGKDDIDERVWGGGGGG